MAAKVKFKQLSFRIGVFYTGARKLGIRKGHSLGVFLLKLYLELVSWWKTSLLDSSILSLRSV